MRRFMSVVALTSFAAGGAYALYRYGLSDEDRETISRAIDSFKGLATDVWERVQPLVEQMTKAPDHSDLANRAATRRQWSELGF